MDKEHIKKAAAICKARRSPLGIMIVFWVLLFLIAAIAGYKPSAVSYGKILALVPDPADILPDDHRL